MISAWLHVGLQRSGMKIPLQLEKSRRGGAKALETMKRLTALTEPAPDTLFRGMPTYVNIRLDRADLLVTGTNVIGHASPSRRVVLQNAHNRCGSQLGP